MRLSSLRGPAARLLRCSAVVAAALLPLSAALPASAAQSTPWRNESDNRCLDADNSSGLNDGAKVAMWGCVIGKNNQTWIWVTENFTYHTFPVVQFEVAGRPSKCLDADMGTIGADGTKIQIWQCGDSTKANQEWVLEPALSGSGSNLINLYAREHRGTGNGCLEGSGGDGGRVQLAKCSTSSSQVWLTQ